MIGAANPLDDVGTARLSRGLADRFVVLELDYQPRDEELEIVRRRSGPARRAARRSPSTSRASRASTPDLRHGASVRGAIDYADLLSGYERTGARPRDAASFLGCSAYAGGCGSSRAPAGRRARSSTRSSTRSCARLRGQRRRRCSSTRPPRRRATRPTATPTAAGSRSEEAEAGLGTGDRPPDEDDRRSPEDEIPGLSRPGGAEAGESRSVPMVDRDQPSARGARSGELDGRRATRTCATPRRSCAPRASSTFGRARGPRASPGPSGLAAAQHALDRRAQRARSTSTRRSARTSPGAATLQREDYMLLEREPHVRHYVILVDHSGSMVGRKLEAGGDDGRRARAALRRGARALRRDGLRRPGRGDQGARRGAATSRTSSSASCACPRAARPISARCCAPPPSCRTGCPRRPTRS